MSLDAYPHPVTKIMNGVILGSTLVGVGASQHVMVDIGHGGLVTKALASCNPRLARDATLDVESWSFVLLSPCVESPQYLTHHERDPSTNGFTHFPSTVCPVEGILEGIRALVSSIRTFPLRQLLIDVFQRRDVFNQFWTMPASARHHHAYPGGLAVHSLEVANDLAGHMGLTDVERELGVAGAPLHDIGKVWTYTHDMFPNAIGLAMGHELAGLSRLEPQLARLEREWWDGAYAMRTLLSGQARVRQNGSLPSALLPRIKACDQRSCEQDRAASRPKGRSCPAWTPRAWKNSTLDESKA